MLNENFLKLREAIEKVGNQTRHLLRALVAYLPRTPFVSQNKAENHLSETKLSFIFRNLNEIKPTGHIFELDGAAISNKQDLFNAFGTGLERTGVRLRTVYLDWIGLMTATSVLFTVLYQTYLMVN